ncbi:MAG: DUF1858 domain-containing protein [Candidatus Micrarchaeota archaeon]|nr:DUF1858 domain-containing protein [Candidatus Micrarchaeota archaeon]
MKKKPNFIQKDMAIGETIKKYPKTAEVFLSIGMHCVGCPMAGMETIEQAATGHGIDLNLLLDKLNAVAK